MEGKEVLEDILEVILYLGHSPEPIQLSNMACPIVIKPLKLMDIVTKMMAGCHSSFEFYHPFGGFLEEDRFIDVARVHEIYIGKSSMVSI